MLSQPGSAMCCQSLCHFPLIILSSRDRVMVPERGLFHQSSQLLMSFMLLLRPQLPAIYHLHLLGHLHLAAGDLCGYCVFFFVSVHVYIHPRSSYIFCDPVSSPNTEKYRESLLDHFQSQTSLPPELQACSSFP